MHGCTCSWLPVTQNLQSQKQEECTQGPMTELKLLDRVFAAAAESQGAESASERSAALLTELHRLLSHACSQSCPQGARSAYYSVSCLIFSARQSRGWQARRSLGRESEKGRMDLSHGAEV